ncbi:MAG: hypothetical protein GX561_10320 [Lentisphaerae bacterium]|jgi:type II secretory pathway pseudopilin PulG|nr:hypothetical protein [Lentisphaerota bacterium]
MKICRQFTLIEILLVVTIMVIIMGFTAPAFSRITRGNAVDVASRMVSGQLALARAEAVSKRQCIAVVMPGARFNPPSSDSSSAFHFTSFRSAIVEEDADGKFIFKKWFPGTEWTFLPNGAVIAEVDGDGEKTKKTSASIGAGIECKVTMEAPNSEVVKEREVNIDWLAADSGLQLNELGRARESGLSVVYEAKAGEMCTGGDNRNTDGIRCIVFKPNGRVAGGSKYVTIVEGVVPATEAPFILTNGNIFNMRLMRVNQFTGKVVFIETSYGEESP